MEILYILVFTKQVHTTLIRPIKATKASLCFAAIIVFKYGVSSDIPALVSGSDAFYIIRNDRVGRAKGGRP